MGYDYFHRTQKGLISLQVFIWSKTGATAVLQMAALDTAATAVTIPTSIAKALGYDFKNATKMLVSTASDETKEVPIVTLSGIKAINEELKDVQAAVLDIPNKREIRVLLGNTFLEHFNFAVYMSDGIIVANPALKKEEIRIEAGARERSSQKSKKRKQ